MYRWDATTTTFGHDEGDGEAMTNRERILKLVRSSPGQTDRQIRETTGIEPHQQVNQICRQLASEGLIARRPGPDGRIGNHPIGQRGRLTERRIVKRAPLRSYEPPHAVNAQSPLSTPPIAVDLPSALIVIPCSASKTHGGKRQISAPGVTTVLTEPTGTRLTSARASVAETLESTNHVGWRPQKGTPAAFTRWQEVPSIG